jgi:thioredoxin-dependent peroxiredoxin
MTVLHPKQYSVGIVALAQVRRCREHGSALHFMKVKGRTLPMTDPMIGKELPDVELKSSQGGQMKLPRDLQGHWTILYFYPKDDTPGCTKQACSYRDGMENFEKINVRVLGVSLDDLTSHDSFIQKFNLNFPLLADTQHQLSEALGSYGDQEWQGKTYQGLSRDTFLIDPQGKVREVWRKVAPTTTMMETYEAVKRYL